VPKDSRNILVTLGLLSGKVHILILPRGTYWSPNHSFVFRDAEHRLETFVVAMDALYFGFEKEEQRVLQYHPQFILRELNKAYLAFSSTSSLSLPVATGYFSLGKIHL
jgi:hypothetical protein